MTERDELLRSIIETPNDDAPRLVFADWLEEHNEGDWAKFIRSQCGFPKHEDVYVAPHWLSYLPSLPRGARWGGWERGFPSEIEIYRSEGITELSSDLAELVPVRRLVVDGAVGRFTDRLASNRGLTWVRELEYQPGNDEDPGGDGACAELIDASHLAGLRVLLLPHFRLTDGAISVLTRDCPWTELHTLDLSGNPIWYDGVTMLTEWQGTSALRDLRLRDTSITNQGFERLIRFGNFPNLGRFDWMFDDCTAIDAMNLARWPILGQLHHLAIGTRLGSELLCSRLASRESSYSTRTLELDFGDPTPEALRMISAPDLWPDVEELRIRLTHWRPPMAELLFERLWVPNLRSLRLECAYTSTSDVPGPLGAAALANNPHLRGVRELQLWNWSIEDEGLRAITEGVAFQELESLSLADYWISQHAFQRLADPSVLPRLRTLNLLGGIQLTRMTAERLRMRFGRRLLCSVREHS